MPMSKQDYRELEAYRALGKPEELGKVVRCKDCRYAWKVGEKAYCREIGEFNHDGNPNNFCSLGERRTDNG